MALLFLIFSSIFLILLLKKYNKRNQHVGMDFPPSPPKLPIIGHLHLLSSLPHRSLHKLSQKYGPILLLQLGRVPTVIVSTAELAKEVMRTNDLQCCSRPPSPGPRRLSYNFLDIAFSPCSDYWREMRKLFILELVSMKRVQSFGYARKAQMDALINSLSQISHEAVNLDEKLYALADGVIGTVAFGKVYFADQFKQKHFKEVLDDTLAMLGSFSAEDFFPSIIGRFVDKLTGMEARRETCFQDIDRYFDLVIDQHLDSRRLEHEQEDLVDALVRLWREQRDTVGLTKDHLKAILMDTFAGGIDTSAVTTSWAMSELIKNPRVMKKLQDEIRNVVGKKTMVEEQDIPKLKYLKMVVKENFRIHMPGPLLILRETMQHCKIGGYDVMPKTRIIVNAWAIGRDPNNWEKSEEFYPERFQDNEIDFRGSNFELVPFGSGRRSCPGMAMGVANVEYTLANLMYLFNWELPKGMKREDINMEEEGQLSFHRKTPLYLVPVIYNGED